MIEEAVDYILKELFSVAGLVSVLVFAALIWQTMQLEKERSARDEDRESDNQRADKRMVAFETLASSISSLSVALARIEGYLLAMKRDE